MYHKLFIQAPSVGQLDCFQMLLLWYSLETLKSKMNAHLDDGVTEGRYNGQTARVGNMGLSTEKEL